MKRLNYKLYIESMNEDSKPLTLCSEKSWIIFTGVGDIECLWMLTLALIIRKSAPMGRSSSSSSEISKQYYKSFFFMTNILFNM